MEINFRFCGCTGVSAKRITANDTQNICQLCRKELQ